MNPTNNYQRLLKLINNSQTDNTQILLLPVTKGIAWDTLQPLYVAGCRRFGENKIQEALPKIAEAPTDIDWHFIGTLQKNKVRKALEHFKLIHSVDSLELALKISECAAEMKQTANILIQVNTSGESSKHGFTEKDFLRDFEKLNNIPYVKIQGLMTMAPETEDAALIRSCFAKLRKLRDKFALEHLSMGMSHDYEIAIEEGATILRIGSAIFKES